MRTATFGTAKTGGTVGSCGDTAAVREIETKGESLAGLVLQWRRRLWKTHWFTLGAGMFIPRRLLQGELVDKSGRYALGCPRSLLRRCCYKYDDVPRLDVRILPLQQSTMSL